MSEGSGMTTEANGSPWGIVAFIAKKDGVLGLFLIALCVFIWWDRQGDREDRLAATNAYKVVVDSLFSAHNKTITIAIQSVEALKASTTAIDNTRQTLQWVENRHHRNVRDN